MKILILLDGSKFSEEVLEPVKNLLSRGGENVEVHLVHVLDQEAAHATWMRTPTGTEEISGILSPPGSLYSRSDLGQGLAVETKNQASDRQHDEAMDYLRHVSALHFNGMARTEVIFAKDIASAIAKYAEAEKPDFVALATHGRTGLLGGVARSLLRAKIAPLYLLRPSKLDGEADQADVVARR